jgi:hypothetical protein
MTTEQRSGFRLPWTPRAEADPGNAAFDVGPFATAADADADAPVDAPVASDVEGEIGATPEAGITDDIDAATVASEVPDESAVTVASETAVDAATIPEPRPRRDNLLVAGLARAMHDAATAARVETTSRFAEETRARIEAIHREATATASATKHAADGDVGAIRDWSKAEMARIREETEERIAVRRRRLELDVEAHAALVEHRIEAIQVSVTTFNRQMDDFFERLLAETNPARLAGLADQMPEPPRLDDLAALDAGWNDGRTLDAEGAAAAEAEAFADLADDESEDAAFAGMVDDDSAYATTLEGGAKDVVEGDQEGSVAGGAFKASAALEVIEAGAVVEAGDSLEASVLNRLAQFAGPPVEQETVTTHVSASGLVSVASIASFKRALARVRGVRSVAVASGTDGEFVFTVQHAEGTDLPGTIPDFDGFATIITGEADGLLSVAVTSTDRPG